MKEIIIDILGEPATVENDTDATVLYYDEVMVTIVPSDPDINYPELENCSDDPHIDYAEVIADQLQDLLLSPLREIDFRGVDAIIVTLDGPDDEYDIIFNGLN